ncbi:MAG: DEAD/DEAH box helicase, partial [Nitrospirae bacterium]|nr:DEAD/DEAH box helicase [Nitrospirota bacterium]
MLIQSNTPDTAERYNFKYLKYPFSPFKHQRKVFERIYHSNILLESPTSSGKTAAVVYPIVDQVQDSNCRALFIYPTRALLWDQYQTISRVASEVSLGVAKIDPYTPTKDLYGIFARNRIIAMTPDIFYLTLLRNAQHYKRFYEKAVESISHIVFDEVHLYDTYMLFNLRNLIMIIREINSEIRIHCLS